MVASVPMTTTLRLWLAAEALAAPGSTTPTTGNARSLANLIESQRSGRVAGDHQHLRAVLFQKWAAPIAYLATVSADFEP